MRAFPLDRKGQKKENQLNTLNFANANGKFPLGWHRALQRFVRDLVTVEYFYGDVVASVAVVMGRTAIHLDLHISLFSDAKRSLRGEADSVLEQIQDRLQNQLRRTCYVCGEPAVGNEIRRCDEHSDVPAVRFAFLPPPKNSPWTMADYHFLIDASTDDVVSQLAVNQRQLAAATVFSRTYEASHVSQVLGRAQARRAIKAIEKILHY